MPLNRPSTTVATALWGALYLVAAIVSHRLNGPIDMTGYIWLPAGVAMAALHALRLALSPAARASCSRQRASCQQRPAERALAEVHVFVDLFKENFSPRLRPLGDSRQVDMG